MGRLARVMAPALVLCVGCGGTHSEEEVTATAPVPVSTQVVTRGTVEAVTTATGIIAAAPGAELIVVAPAAGRIARLPKAEGDTVRKGDLLVEFDIPSSDADVAAREAELAQARAKLTNSHNALTRLQGLLERGIAARKEVEDAQRDVADAEAAVTNAEAGRAAARRVAARTTVVAPFTGVIAKRWHNPGDLVEAAATDPVLRVVDPARTEVSAAIPATVANRVKPSQAARIRAAIGDSVAAADAATETETEAGFWPASVLTRPTVVDPATATSSVRLALKSPRPAALPPIGTAVRVDIVTDVHQMATTVPGSAVAHEDDKAFVYVVGDDKKAHRREVKVGLMSETAIEIVSGVTPGVNVIVRGHEALPDGAAVRIEGADDAEGEKGGKGEKSDKGEKGEKGEKAAEPAAAKGGKSSR